MSDKFVEFRPWGKFTRYTLNEPTTVKVIAVNPSQKLSVQRHENRDELWIPFDDGLYALIGDETIKMIPDREYFIPRGTIHSVESKSIFEARFLEIAFGQFDEDDIERLEDRYGRV